MQSAGQFSILDVTKDGKIGLAVGAVSLHNVITEFNFG
jgi:hypothetical protein